MTLYRLHLFRDESGEYWCASPADSIRQSLLKALIDSYQGGPKAAAFKKMPALLIEARDALPAITMMSAKLRGIDLTLADRIENCLKPWEVKS